MGAKLVVAVVVISFDGRILDGAVHPLDLAVCSRMIDFGEAVLDSGFAAAHSEHTGGLLGGWAAGVTWRVSELDAVVGQDSVDSVRDGGDQADEERRRGHASSAINELYEGKLACPINGHEKVELAFGRLDFGDVDVKEADRVGLEPLLGLYVTFNVRQTINAVALQAAVQRRPAQTRNSGLQSV